MKELKANTRELFFCKHFLPQLSVKYLTSFIHRLMIKKQEFLEQNKILYPVTFYMWTRSWGNNNLNFNFISGHATQLPFGKNPHQTNYIQKTVHEFLFPKLHGRRKMLVYVHYLNQHTVVDNSQPKKTLADYKEFISTVGSRRAVKIPARLIKKSPTISN
jgi:hypothetical protein